MKKLLICCVAALLLVLTVVSVYASPPDYFYLEKVCSDPDSPFCDLQNADPLDDLNGGQIEYKTCASAPDKFLCKVVLTTANGDGMVYGRVRWVSDHGYFTLRRGEGTLAGLHAVGRIDWKEDSTFSRCKARIMWIPSRGALGLAKVPELSQGRRHIGDLALPLDFRHKMLFNRGGVAVP